MEDNGIIGDGVKDVEIPECSVNAKSENPSYPVIRKD